MSGYSLPLSWPLRTGEPESDSDSDSPFSSQLLSATIPTSPFSSQRFDSQPPSAQSAKPLEFHQTIFHMCHLANAILTGLSTYLSMEAITRDMGTNGFPLYGYPDHLAALAIMLGDAAYNLCAARDVCIAHERHPAFFRNPAYNALLMAGNLYKRVVRWPDIWRKERRLGTAVEMGRFRRGVEEAYQMCSGDRARHRVGWETCWQLVKAYEDEHKALEART